jgi:hypothetical protein
MNGSYSGRGLGGGGLGDVIYISRYVATEYIAM